MPDNYTFWDLHVAIQDSMGWYDTHLHQFAMTGSDGAGTIEIGMPDPDFDDGILSGWDQDISAYFSLDNRKAEYVYDFGDGWVHEIKLEEILPTTSKQYPICLDGERACPPEDVGSVPGYEEFIKAISYQNHKHHKEMMEWIGRPFDPDHFKPEEVIFDNPKERLKNSQ